MYTIRTFKARQTFAKAKSPRGGIAHIWKTSRASSKEIPSDFAARANPSGVGGNPEAIRASVRRSVDTNPYHEPSILSVNNRPQIYVRYVTYTTSPDFGTTGESWPGDCALLRSIPDAVETKGRDGYALRQRVARPFSSPWCLRALSRREACAALSIRNHGFIF
jgi:hypothetical protein